MQVLAPISLPQPMSRLPLFPGQPSKICPPQELRLAQPSLEGQSSPTHLEDRAGQRLYPATPSTSGHLFQPHTLASSRLSSSPSSSLSPSYLHLHQVGTLHNCAPGLLQLCGIFFQDGCGAEHVHLLSSEHSGLRTPSPERGFWVPFNQNNVLGEEGGGRGAVYRERQDPHPSTCCVWAGSLPPQGWQVGNTESLSLAQFREAQPGTRPTIFTWPRASTAPGEAGFRLCCQDTHGLQLRSRRYLRCMCTS